VRRRPPSEAFRIAYDESLTVEERSRLLLALAKRRPSLRIQALGYGESLLRLGDARAA
jgi:hypothetical protein